MPRIMPPIKLLQLIVSFLNPIMIIPVREAEKKATTGKKINPGSEMNLKFEKLISESIIPPKIKTRKGSVIRLNETLKLLFFSLGFIEANIMAGIDNPIPI